MVPAELYQEYAAHVAAQFKISQQLLVEHEFDGLLIAAGSEQSPFRDDYTYPFKANPYFKTWVPLLNRAHCYIWIDVKATKPVLFLYQPIDIWHQVDPLTDGAILAAFDLRVLSSPGELEKEINSSPRLAFIGPSQECHLVDVSVNPEPLLAALDYRRAYKSPYEWKCIRLANEKAAIGHRAAAAAFRGGATEYEIHMAYLQATAQLDEDLPYGNIIALNEHASVLHYTQKDRQSPAEHRSFLIDAGATVGGYAADISRTYAFAGGLFQSLVTAMDKLQQEIVAHIRIGESYLDLHLYAHRRIAELLVVVGLVKTSAEDAVELGLTALFFPHGLGHLLGAQVHDLGGWQVDPKGLLQPPPQQHPYLRLTRPIEEEQVFTIEPGLYFIPSLLNPAGSGELGRWIDWGLVGQLLPYGGIRIEDNIYVDKEGPINLTRVVLRA